MVLMKKLIIALLTAVTLIAAGCSSTATPDSGKVSVSASFYPIAWLTEEIGGDLVEVNLVTPANVEPHDFELAPKDIAHLEKTQLIAYVPDFQPSLDDAVALQSGPDVLDLGSAVDLVSLSDSQSRDPHFWLDPKRMEAAASAIGAKLTDIDPKNAATYQANLADLIASLGELDSKYQAGLATCQRRTIITSHSAFGYLAQRYDLTQASVSGIDPEAEPSPADMNKIKKIIQSTESTTIFTESLVSSKTAEALASETGAQVKVLNTIESEPDGLTYLQAMETNLEEIRVALECSPA